MQREAGFTRSHDRAAGRLSFCLDVVLLSSFLLCHRQFTPSELYSISLYIKGGDLCEAKSTSLILYSHSCVNALLGSVTNTHNYDRDCAYANDFRSHLNSNANVLGSIS